MARLKELTPIVKEILTNYPETQKDDFLLIEKVYNIFVDTNLSLKSIFKNHVLFKIPSSESITRCRRKIQEKELVNEKAKQIRSNEIPEYKEYAKI